MDSARPHRLVGDAATSVDDDISIDISYFGRLEFTYRTDGTMRVQTSGQVLTDGDLFALGPAKAVGKVATSVLS